MMSAQGAEAQKESVMNKVSMFSIFACAIIFCFSCAMTTRAEDAPKEGEKKEEKKTPKVPLMKVAAGDWCEEHGLPESVCTRCSEKAAATAKENGDWCKKHKRADSQCFLCHPELKDQWLALKPKDAGAKESEKK